ncbi:uncharacterized protein LOC106876652 [Octopus bimaculoides]|uniref:uncharacterized protein LOC106876652 n=1 Tax=Octopus bimaculoides TaxID=37653 RepID=UPI00071E256F|nr:uncharacterized protein LOC106876652 [Octopus bimaculoides]|eukprot:XP_014780754.1 PREDICTED: uncharacterized protein LOC106876652 [Octopus bimaculoides]
MFPLLSHWMDGDKDKLLQNLNLWQKNQKPVVLCTFDGMNKSSLLFQCAISYAKEGNHVTYICQEPFTHLPLTVHGMSKPSSASLGMVKFMYLKTLPELYDYCASIHQSVLCPQVIILDGIHFYVQQTKRQQYGEEQEAAQLCAMLMDAVQYCHTRNSSSKTFDETQSQLIISCKDSKFLLPVFQKLNFQIISSKVKGDKRRITEMAVETMEENIFLSYSVEPTEGIYLNDIKCIAKE